jgi:hypothetical protein
MIHLGFQHVFMSCPRQLRQASCALLVTLVCSAHALAQSPQPQSGPPPKDTRAKLQLALPPAEEIFRFEPEAVFRERIHKEFATKGGKASFPQDAPLGPPMAIGTPTKTATLQTALFHPHLLCHGPLLFRDQRSERYGRDLGRFIQPAASLGKFYFDTLILPYSLCARPPWRCECRGYDWGADGDFHQPSLLEQPPYSPRFTE